MSKQILQELPELVSKNVITEEIAQNIKKYYQNKPNESPNRLFVIFGVIGALLGGLGIILILAHNWDDFSVSTKTIISFIPLLLGQIACFYSLFKKTDSQVWHESSATFLLFAIAATISLIAQVYNLPSDFDSFLLTWIILALPLIYIMNSSFVSLLIIAGITWYCSTINYGYPKSQEWYQWGLLSLVVPHYHGLLKNKPTSNFTRFHHWFIAAALLIMLPSISLKNNTLLIIGFFSLLSIFYFIGKFNFFNQLNQFRNAYWLIGKIGLLLLFFIFSFKAPWEEIQRKTENIFELDSTIYLILTIAALYFLYKHLKKETLITINPIAFAFILYTILYFVSYKTEAFTLVTFTNVFILLIGVYEIKKGADSESIYKLNMGLSIIAILIICRFFDTEMSFVVRGILFLVIGIGFFAMNYYLIKKRSHNEK